jgi:hypothetical protein
MLTHYVSVVAQRLLVFAGLVVVLTAVFALKAAAVVFGSAQLVLLHTAVLVLTDSVQHIQELVADGYVTAAQVLTKLMPTVAILTAQLLLVVLDSLAAYRAVYAASISQYLFLLALLLEMVL